MEFDTCGQRWAAWFLSKEGSNATEIQRRLQLVCGDGAPTVRTVQRWVASFQEGRDTTADAQRSGRPAVAVTEENIQRAENLISDDHRITVRELGDLLGVGIARVSEILHNYLNVKKVTCRWVPKTLTPQMKQDRVDISGELLCMEGQHRRRFYNRLVTGDESWFRLYEPETRRESKEWRHPGDPPPRHVRTQPSAMKHMATVFWDAEGIILLKWLPRGQTINSDYYCQILSELKAAIQNERPGKWETGVLLQQDNARPHTSAQTMAAIQNLGFTAIPHPAYSPDLAPSDFWLFGEIKKHLRGNRYDTLQQLGTAIYQWRQRTPPEWFETGLRKLHERWNLCISRQGDFVELPTEDD